MDVDRLQPFSVSKITNDGNYSISRKLFVISKQLTLMEGLNCFGSPNARDTRLKITNNDRDQILLGSICLDLRKFICSDSSVGRAFDC